MKKVMAKGLALAFLGSLFMAGNALALPVLTMSDGTTTITVADNGVGDTANSVDGVITYAGMFGGWNVVMSMGTSYPAIGSLGSPELHLSSSLTSVNAPGAYGGTFSFTFEDNFTAWADLGGLVTSIGGDAAGAVSLKTYLDGVEIASLGVFTGAFSDSVANYGASPANDDLYNLKIAGVITHDSVGQASSFDASVAPVPEPATMLLFGSGLAGLAGYGRRKARKK
ncbi:MAG: PEP-CTERM sorting domain-containing protein [Deltaproteobacteria bacterium]|nr:PEP-CTERM sorting domain-containing protein [Deltaproteobacteria bacterium]